MPGSQLWPPPTDPSLEPLPTALASIHRLGVENGLLTYFPLACVWAMEGLTLFCTDSPLLMKA